MVQTVVLQVLLKLTELHNVELRQLKKHLEDDRLNQKKGYRKVTSTVRRKAAFFMG